MPWVAHVWPRAAMQTFPPPLRMQWLDLQALSKGHCCRLDSTACNGRVGGRGGRWGGVKGEISGWEQQAILLLLANSACALNLLPIALAPALATHHTDSHRGAGIAKGGGQRAAAAAGEWVGGAAVG